MEETPIRLGPLALLLTVVSICLSVLAILTFTTAWADHALAEQYGETVQTRYALEQQGQRFLAEAGMRLHGALDDSGAVIRWTMDREWTENNTIDGLWPGT